MARIHISAAECLKKGGYRSFDRVRLDHFYLLTDFTQNKNRRVFFGGEEDVRGAYIQNEVRKI